MKYCRGQIDDSFSIGFPGEARTQIVIEATMRWLVHWVCSVGKFGPGGGNGSS